MHKIYPQKLKIEYGSFGPQDKIEYKDDKLIYSTDRTIIKEKTPTKEE